MKTRFNPFTSKEPAVGIDRTESRTAPRKSRAGIKQPRRKRPPLSAEEALARAQSGLSLANYPAIYAGFKAKGLAESEIRPRENVFTFKAWIAQGRRVKKGEHGVKIASVIETPIKEEVDPETGQVTVITKRRPWTSTVFHISQTEAIAVQGAPAPPSKQLRARSVETSTRIIETPVPPVETAAIPSASAFPTSQAPGQPSPTSDWRSRWLKGRQN